MKPPLQTRDTMNLSEVVSVLNNLAPTSLAESWDNVGLLVEPPNIENVSILMVTNDLTESVMDEAIERKVDMILSYHPPIFKALKAIKQDHWKQRVISKCLAHCIAVYSPHTAYDALKGGVSDWLIAAFGDGEVNPITSSVTKPVFSHQLLVTLDSSQPLSRSLQSLQDNLQSQAHCRCVSLNDSNLIVLCTASSITSLIECITNVLGDAVVAHSLTKLEKLPVGGAGLGRTSRLAISMSLGQAVQKVKDYLGLTHVRLALAKDAAMDSPVRIVAACPGSGSSVLQGVRADCLLTGEMSHHDILEAIHGGASVILTEHSNCERGFLWALQGQLSEALKGKVEVVVSQEDADPIIIV